MKKQFLYRVEWKHNGQWRMEENGIGTFKTLAEAKKAQKSRAYERVETRIVKLVDFSKTIGLVHLIGGGYRPTNERQRIKLNRLFREGSGGLFANAPEQIQDGQLVELRRLAAEAGYTILTTRKCL